MHQDLEIGVPSYVTKDVFVVVKSLVKNQCKGYKTFPFSLSLLSFLFRYLSYLFPRYVTPWCMCGLIGVVKSFIRKLKIRFPTHGVKDVFGIMYPQYWLQPNCDASLVMHLKVLKIVF
jgi:hypothetical protein